MLNIPYSVNDGCNTRVGQAVMHSWQAVQFDVKWSIDFDPGGDETEFFLTATLLCFCGIILIWESAFVVSPIMNKEVFDKKSLLDLSLLCLTIPEEIN